MGVRRNFPGGQNYSWRCKNKFLYQEFNLCKSINYKFDIAEQLINKFNNFS